VRSKETITTAGGGTVSVYTQGGLRRPAGAWTCTCGATSEAGSAERSTRRGPQVTVTKIDTVVLRQGADAHAAVCEAGPAAGGE
jgi:hypothetical protein